jgi:hypothetical protein
MPGAGSNIKCVAEGKEGMRIKGVCLLIKLMKLRLKKQFEYEKGETLVEFKRRTSDLSELSPNNNHYVTKAFP